MREILTKQSPRWGEFIHRLNGCLKSVDDCDHSLGKSKAVFKAMGGVDDDGTIAFLNKNGGHCDCEVMLNVVKWDENGEGW